MNGAGSRLPRRAEEGSERVDRLRAAGNQMCSDAIQFKVVGAIAQPLLEWINRPTFPQADDLTGRPG